MTPQAIEKIKSDGVSRMIKEKIDSLLYHAQKDFEEAKQNNFKAFTVKIHDAQDKIEDAIQLFKELP